MVFLFLFLKPHSLFKRPTSYIIEASNGSLLSASIANDGQWRFPASTSVPEKFKQCIIHFEDKRFYEHIGVDVLAMGRAIEQNFNAGKIVSGGSTITMQVVRISGKRKRNIWQKMIEVVLAARLELTNSKEDIMNLYASNAPFGTNVIGLEAAAWRYYGRDPDALSWGEMATLAVLPNSPSLVRPGKNTSKLIRKRNDLIDKLYENIKAA
ncbi:MAG: penicillin-binding protein 1C, partial [Pedobacter sp.]